MMLRIGRDIVEVRCRICDHTVFHLTNPKPPTMEQKLKCEKCGHETSFPVLRNRPRAPEELIRVRI